MLKSLYLDPESENENDIARGLKNTFLTLYKENERIKNKKIGQMQDISSMGLYVLRKLSISKIVKRRFENLSFMYNEISNKDYLLFGFDEIKSPFVLPLIFKNEKERNIVKQRLIDNGVYPPIHWALPGEVTKNYVYEQDLSNKVLSIPIDQRYTEKELSIIAKIVDRKIL